MFQFYLHAGRNGYNDKPEVTAFRTALRAVALSNLLRPISNTGNCQMDHDTLLVDVLDSAAVAESKSTGGARRSAINGARVAARYLGVGVMEEENEWASEDEGDVLDSDDEIDCKAISHAENQVIDCLGGYVVTRLQRQKKLTCIDCCNALVRTTQRSIMVQEKQFESCSLLSSSTPCLRTFLLHAETIVR